jgi:hypothetical protein
MRRVVVATTIYHTWKASAIFQNFKLSVLHVMNAIKAEAAGDLVNLPNLCTGLGS